MQLVSTDTTFMFHTKPLLSKLVTNYQCCILIVSRCACAAYKSQATHESFGQFRLPLCCDKQHEIMWLR